MPEGYIKTHGSTPRKVCQESIQEKYAAVSRIRTYAGKPPIGFQSTPRGSIVDLAILQEVLMDS